MERQLNAPEITHSSQCEDGLMPQVSWKERSHSATKTCPACFLVFAPKMVQQKGRHKPNVQSEKNWSKQVTCSPSCAKRWKNPMHNASSRQKMRATLKRIGHKPPVVGGNGRDLTVPQQALLDILGDGWIAEHPIATGKGHRNGVYPNAYKADLACPEEMIVVEVDGASHGTLARQAGDKKRDALLAQLGWKVFRVSNSRALKLSTTCTSADTLLTLLGAS